MIFINARQYEVCNYVTTDSLLVRSYSVDDQGVHANEHHSVLTPKYTGEPLTIFIHGYNRSFKSVVTAFEGIKSTMESCGVPGQVIGLIWPSGNEVLDYWEAADRARETGVMLADQIMVLASCGFNVSLVGHSLGCEVIRECIDELWTDYEAGHVKSIILCGAAVGKHEFQDTMTLSSNYTSWLNLTSRNDMVLKYLFPLAELELALGRHTSCTSIPSNVTQKDGTDFINGHTDYKNELVLGVIAQHLKGEVL